MTQVSKETIFNAEFRRDLASSNQPEWLKNLRERAFRFFTENGFPTPQNEDWKYTNVSSVVDGQWSAVSEQSEESASSAEIAPFVFDESKKSVLVFVNGSFDKSLSNLDAITEASDFEFCGSGK